MPRTASGPALRLHLDRDELPSSSRAFQIGRGDRRAAAGADVRRERADPVQALLRPGEIELAVGRLDHLAAYMGSPSWE